MKLCKRVNETLAWIGISSIWWFTAVEGTVYNEHHFLSAFKFLTWFVYIFWLFLFVADTLALSYGNAETKDEWRRTKSKSPRIVSVGISFASDFGLAMLVAAYGHWVYALMIMLQQFMEINFFNNPKEKVSD